MGQILLSKTARAVAALLLIVLLLTVTTSWLPTEFSSKKFLPSIAQNCTNDQRNDAVDWSRFAYVQYATNDAYLCNSVMLFEVLHRLDSKADRLLMYPSDFQIEEDPNTPSYNGRLLKVARDKYNVKLKAIEVQRRDGGDGKFAITRTNSNAKRKLMLEAATWAESFTKLLAFNQTQYDRVLHLDSDSTVLQVH